MTVHLFDNKIGYQIAQKVLKTLNKDDINLNTDVSTTINPGIFRDLKDRTFLTSTIEERKSHSLSPKLPPIHNMSS